MRVRAQDCGQMTRSVVRAQEVIVTPSSFEDVTSAGTRDCGTKLYPRMMLLQQDAMTPDVLET